MRSSSEFLTVGEVAKLLRRSRSLVYKTWPTWAKQGAVPVRVGGGVKGGLLFRRCDIERLLSRWQVGGCPPEAKERP